LRQFASKCNVRATRHSRPKGDYAQR
jgi:hypothetical protein